MKTFLLLLLLVATPIFGSEIPRVFPFWDGTESVEAYAKRADLPATKSFDLGGGVKLELVLIPAGAFLMGTVEPERPTITEENSIWIMVLGGAALVILLFELGIHCIKKRTFVFSLRTLLLLTIATGTCAGGIARRMIALDQAEQYREDILEFNQLSPFERPARKVTIKQPFYLGKYTVTQEQYKTVMGNHQGHFEGDQLPVDTVSWEDAIEFSQRLTAKVRDPALSFDLPAEEQWEYACRAGTRLSFYSGNGDCDFGDVGWCQVNSDGTTHTVGQKKPNAFGLYDMHGNVRQWCYVDKSANNSTREFGGTQHVSRGGSWADAPDNCRSAYRCFDYSQIQNHLFGFRVVLSGLNKR